MQPQWHIAYSNVTTTEYAGITYRDYYRSPAAMLEAQLRAKEHIERRFGTGRFMGLGVDLPHAAFGSMLGMTVVEPADADEMPYLDTSRPLISDVAQAGQLRLGNPQTDGWMGKRYEFWQYYQAQGHKVGFGGASGAIITVAAEISGGAVFAGLLEDPENAGKVLDFALAAEEQVAAFGAKLAGVEYQGMGYTGDDYAGLLSPALFRKFAVPYYLKLYTGESRFMHSELLRAEHLRICRDEVGVTMFHGAGCKLLTLAEMHEIMGENFWTQITPQEMSEWTPAQLEECVKLYANCGCRYVQLYPGRNVPDANIDAAIAACQRECAGGMV